MIPTTHPSARTGEAQVGMRFVLVHSPVVGPSTWRWVADALCSAGHEAVVPDLVAAALTGDPRVFAHAAAEKTNSDSQSVLVGHSGAGAVLPLVASALEPWPQQVIFVDAGIPPCEGTFTAGGDCLGPAESSGHGWSSAPLVAVVGSGDHGHPCPQR